MSQAHVCLPRTGPRYGLVGDVYTILATGRQTGGKLAVVESRVPPGGGPPPHVHSREDESFYVLSGTVTFITKAGPVKAGAGSFVHLPRGVPHTFKNETEVEARMLIVCAPSGFDEMVKELGTMLAGPDAAALPPTPEEIERVVSVCPRYGITIPVEM